MIDFRKCFDVRLAEWLAMIFSALCLASMPVIAQQKDADYLKSVAGAAAGVTVDQQTTEQASGEASNTTHLFKNGRDNERGGARVDLTAGLTLEQFVTVLKNNYIGSYLFYSRLKDKQKAQVYSYYQSNPDEALVRKKILQLSKQR